MRARGAPSRMHRKRKCRRTTPRVASRTLRRSFPLQDESEHSPGGARRLRPMLCFWLPHQVRRQNQPPAFLDGETQRRQRLPNTRVVSDYAILERNIEVHADEHTLSAQIEIIDRQLVHAVLGKLSDDAAGVPRIKTSRP